MQSYPLNNIAILEFFFLLVWSVSKLMTIAKTSFLTLYSLTVGTYFFVPIGGCVHIGRGLNAVLFSLHYFTIITGILDLWRT